MSDSSDPHSAETQAAEDGACPQPDLERAHVILEEIKEGDAKEKKYRRITQVAAALTILLGAIGFTTAIVAMSHSNSALTASNETLTSIATAQGEQLENFSADAKCRSEVNANVNQTLAPVLAGLTQSTNTIFAVLANALSGGEKADTVALAEQLKVSSAATNDRLPAYLDAVAAQGRVNELCNASDSTSTTTQP